MSRLRHTYASLLLSHGVSPVYVQRQLGHASIKLTADAYGRWLPIQDDGAVEWLSGIGRRDSQSVATTKPGRSGVLERSAFYGEPSRDRTEDPLIKSRRNSAHEKLGVTIGYTRLAA